MKNNKRSKEEIEKEKKEKLKEKNKNIYKIRKLCRGKLKRNYLIFRFRACEKLLFRDIFTDFFFW